MVGLFRYPSDSPAFCTASWAVPAFASAGAAFLARAIADRYASFAKWAFRA